MTNLNITGTVSADLTGIQGEQGIQGIQGPAGAQGVAGPAGPKGDKGDTGAGGASTWINALDYGFTPDNSNFDNSLILNQFNSDNSTATKDLYFPPGNYYFLTKPNAITTKIGIHGSSVNATGFTRKFTPIAIGDAIIHSQSTIVIENIYIHTINGNNGGCAIHLDGLGASASILRNLYITSPDGSTWGITIYLESSHALGIRGCLMEQIESFACTSHGIWLNNVKGLNMIGVQHYLAGGTAQHITIQGQAGQRSSNVLYLTRYCPLIYLYDTDNVKIIGIGGTSQINTRCTNIAVI